MDSQPLVLTAADPEPDLNPGTIVVPDGTPWVRVHRQSGGGAQR